MDLSKYKALFVEESRDHVSELSRLLVALESSPEPAPLIDEIFRHAHSLKGMAASMGYDAISTLAHRTEDVVGLHKKRGAPVPKGTIDKLLAAVDALAAQVQAAAEERPIPPETALVESLIAEAQEAPYARIDSTAPPRNVAPAAAGPRVAAGCIVRLRVSAAAPAAAVRAFLVHRRLATIGTIVDAQPTTAALKAGELSTPDVQVTLVGADDAAIRRVLAGIGDIEAVTIAPVENPQPAKPARLAEVGDGLRSASTIRVRTDVLDTLIDSVGELFIARERLTSLLADVSRPDLRAALDGLSARIRELHDQVMAVRMMPLRVLTERYPRLVRDLSRSLDKEVELEIEGSDIELDRAILDHLDAVFVHTLRNAVDHGIEPTAVREQRSKPRAGKVRVTAARDRDMVLVSIEDDGRGLDAEAVRRIAVERGLISTREAEDMSARESYFLVCLPGFSTKTQVSDVSGRGVGMDVVRAKIESLGGTLDIESELGRSTRFIFRLPLTLAIIPVLLVEAAGATFAIPVAKVVSVREKGDDIIRQPGGRAYLSFRHALVPVAELSELLKIAPSGDSEFVVIVEDGRDLSGLGVRRLVGYHEAVVKPLGEPLDRLEWFSGAAVLGDGNPILILDLPRALRQRPVAA